MIIGRKNGTPLRYLVITIRRIRYVSYVRVTVELFIDIYSEQLITGIV